ncbi:MAG: hypothetical protein ABSA46_17270 [Thermodesulfovibrionales bacterium]|jgi:hypothetical protein
MDRGYALEATQLYHAIDKVLQRNTLVLGGGGNESLPPPPLNAFLLRVAVAFVVDLEVSDLWTFVAVFVVAFASVAVAFVADLEVSDPWTFVAVVPVADLEVSDPWTFVAVVPVADLEVSDLWTFVAVVPVADLEVSDLWTFVAVFVVLVPVSVPVIEVDSSGRPFLASPNVDLFASPSSSVEVVAEEPVDSSMGARSNYGLYSILSNLDLHQDRNLEPFYSNPSPDHNNVSDTNDLPKGATTNHSRKKSLH